MMKLGMRWTLVVVLMVMLSACAATETPAPTLLRTVTPVPTRSATNTPGPTPGPTDVPLPTETPRPAATPTSVQLRLNVQVLIQNLDTPWAID